MRMFGRRMATAWACVAIHCLTAAAAAQEGLVAGASDGWSSFRTAVDEDVWICERGSVNRSGDRWAGRHEGCSRGEVEILVHWRTGRVVDIRQRPVGSGRGPEVDRDLGWIAPADVADFMIELVPDAEQELAQEALGVAAMADGVVIWPSLEEYALDRSLPRDVRKAALFWLGQEAADQAIVGIRAVIDTPDEEVDVKEAAVFALSQRPESVDLLLDIARTADHPDVKRSAMFWLAQHDDVRVIEFFRSILETGD